MNTKTNLIDVLPYIDPADLSYQEWCNVGMALKHEGYTAFDWETWSKQDVTRFKPGECYKKWDSFQGNTYQPVTGATIVQMAKDNGWEPVRDQGHEIEWDGVIGAKKSDLVIIDQHWIEGKEIHEPDDSWNPVNELIRYLEILFESTENVGYVTTTWDKDGEFKPTKGNWDRTAGQLIEQLSKCGGDIGKVIGDCKEEVGAWIRFNPLDGKGCTNDNVTDFRYALVESDKIDLDMQNAIIRKLELPVACLVHSGNKSIHAIVRIDAGSYEEYRQRVNYLYDVCQKNGLKIDMQNRNPSRLSRMPGIMRNGKRQFLIDTNIGKESWNEWHDWIEGVNDDLPDPENLTAVWNNMPDLAPPLIDGVLRQGHKMLLAGPSKAGKSYALIELCIAIAEGKEWLQWTCTKGRVLYVNLELDRASCLHRFKDVYQALQWQPNGIGNIDVWNLRGKSVPMDKLAPKLIRRAQKKEYIAIVIDPIYKVITGDENSADQMAHFTNQFDKVCTELGSAVIYCHHHSKGYQGNKRSMDRASGSGVFARDPDALLDLVELELPDKVIKQEEAKAAAKVIFDMIQRVRPSYIVNITSEERNNELSLELHSHKVLDAKQRDQLAYMVEQAKTKARLTSAWRIEGTLREYPKFAPINVWFDYPIHNVDTSGILDNVDPEGDKAPWQKAMEKRKSPEKKKEQRENALEMAFASFELEGRDTVTINDLIEEMGVSRRTVWNRIKEHGGFKSAKTADGKESIITRNDDEPVQKT